MIMKKIILIPLLVLSVFPSGCYRFNFSNETVEDRPRVGLYTWDNPIPFEEAGVVDFLESRSVPGSLKMGIEKNGVEEIHPDQITEAFGWADMEFFFVLQPNANVVLESVREWENEGHVAKSGLLTKHVQGDLQWFFQIKEEDFNPVGLYLGRSKLVLDIADDSGAGSGEGKLLRYVYHFAGVDESTLHQWQKAESCEGYYVPETYWYGSVECDDDTVNTASEPEQALTSFFAALAAEDFEKAVAYFDFEGRGEPITYSSANDSPARIMENYCSSTGTCLNVKILKRLPSDRENQTKFLVQFIESDGSVYEFGPCCGANEEDQPTRTRFEYNVENIDGVYKVIDLPLYRP